MKGPFDPLRGHDPQVETHSCRATELFINERVISLWSAFAAFPPFLLLNFFLFNLFLNTWLGEHSWIQLGIKC